MNTVSIIMGSDSDKHISKDVSEQLEKFGISYETRIISAHRTPDILREYVRSAVDNGVLLFIAVAGMAAALPGVVASYTTRPVIGVPVSSSSPVLGFDSLFSIVQMPPGIPVATVTINGGRNAAVLAAEILGIRDQSIQKKLARYRIDTVNSIVQKDRELSKE
jgi:5-(carboxyamino)imidazole ribonucleotide mutase